MYKLFAKKQLNCNKNKFHSKKLYCKVKKDALWLN